MNDSLKKRAAEIWKHVEAEGSAWQKRLGTGSRVIPLYELRRYWNDLASVSEKPEHRLEKQTREFEVARLRAEVERLRKMLALAVARTPTPTRVTEIASVRAMKSNEAPPQASTK